MPCELDNKVNYKDALSSSLLLLLLRPLSACTELGTQPLPFSPVLCQDLSFVPGDIQLC